MDILFLLIIVLISILVMFSKYQKTIVSILFLLLIVSYFAIPKISMNLKSHKSWEVPRNLRVIMDKAVEYEARNAVWPENLLIDLPDAYNETKSKKWEYSIKVIKDTTSVDTFRIVATSKKKLGKLPTGGFITIDNWGNKQYSHEFMLKMGGPYLSDAKHCVDE